MSTALFMPVIAFISSFLHLLLQHASSNHNYAASQQNRFRLLSISTTTYILQNSCNAYKIFVTILCFACECWQCNQHTKSTIVLHNMRQHFAAKATNALRLMRCELFARARTLSYIILLLTHTHTLTHTYECCYKSTQQQNNKRKTPSFLLHCRVKSHDNFKLLQIFCCNVCLCCCCCNCGRECRKFTHYVLSSHHCWFLYFNWLLNVITMRDVSWCASIAIHHAFMFAKWFICIFIILADGSDVNEVWKMF